MVNTVPVSSSAVRWSLYNWYNNGTYAITINPGAYFSTTFSGTSFAIAVDVSAFVAASVSSTNYPRITYSIDNGALVDITLTSASATLTLATGLTAGTHTVYCELTYSSQNIDRWNTPISALKITSFAIDDSASLTLPTGQPQTLLVFSDSIGEGVGAGGTGNIAGARADQTFVPYLANALKAEYGNVSFGSQGWNAQTPANVPKFYDTTTPANSAWYRLFSGQSRLVGGQFNPLPNYLVCVMGTNDGLNSVADGIVTNAVNGWLGAVRSAAPGVWIFVVTPFGGFKESAITAGFNAYQLATPDSKAALINSSSMPSTTSLGITSASLGVNRFSSDGIHPNRDKHAKVAAALAIAIQAKLGTTTVVVRKRRSLVL